MNEKNEKRGLFNENPDLIEKCETCAFATSLSYCGDFLCSKYGAVSPDWLCKKYKVNRFLKKPPKKRKIDTSRFSPDDFSIE